MQLVPVELCRIALRDGTWNTLAVYLAIKRRCSGKFRMNTALAKEIAGELGFKTYKTVNNHFSKLLELGWVYYTPKSGWHGIKGNRWLEQRYNTSFRQRARLAPQHYQDIQLFCTAALIELITRKMRYRHLQKEAAKAERNKRCSSTPSMPIAVRYLACVIGCSSSKVDRLIHKAQCLGYIHGRNVYVDLGTRTAVEVNQLLRGFPEAEPYLRRKRLNHGLVRLFEIQPKSYVSSIELKKSMWKNVGQ